jgi:hypothetical protein
VWRRAVQDASFYSTESHTVYQADPIPALGPAHARNLIQSSSKRIADLATCGGPTDSLLGRLYARPSLRELVRVCAGLPRLHLSACPFNAAYYNAYAPGDGLGWHFDRSAFGVCVVLQSPGAGGRFEFHHNTRDAAAGTEAGAGAGASDAKSEAEFRRVEAIVSWADRRGVVAVEGTGPGSLVVFAGRESLHRVSPVTAAPPRINAILTYEALPGQRPGPYSLARFFGRTADGICIRPPAAGAAPAAE